MSSSKNVPVKLVVVGDTHVGKTSMVLGYLTNTLPNNYVPTITDTHTAHVTNPEKKEVLNITFVDTAGSEEYDRIRSHQYPQTDLVIFVFSVVDPESFHNIRTKWFPEISHHCPNVPKILVGTQSDLSTNPVTIQSLAAKGEKPVTEEEANLLCHEIGADKYICCSAVTKKNLSDVFGWGITVLQKEGKKNPKLTLLPLSAPYNYEHKIQIELSSAGIQITSNPLPATTNE